MPLFSIVIPVYNVEQYLSQCIESVVAQTCPDWELILVNDGSRDASGSIADNYAAADSRIRVFHKPNGGASSARNLGLEKACGEYICFIDSDDWIEPDMLSHFGVTADSINADMYISGATFVIDGKPYSRKCYEPFYSADRSETGVKFARQGIFNNGYPWGKLYKTSIIRENGLIFDGNLSLRQDHMFVFDFLGLARTVAVTGEAPYHYLVLIVDNDKRSLSSRYIPYAELVYTAQQFEQKISMLGESLHLDSSTRQGMWRKFVAGNHLEALRALFREDTTNENIIAERDFWKSDEAASMQLSTYNRLLIGVITKIKPVILVRIIMKTIIWLADRRPRNDRKIRFRDLAGRSSEIITQ